jgi:hypothetical protein
MLDITFCKSCPPRGSYSRFRSRFRCTTHGSRERRADEPLRIQARSRIDGHVPVSRGAFDAVRAIGEGPTRRRERAAVTVEVRPSSRGSPRGRPSGLTSTGPRGQESRSRGELRRRDDDGCHPERGRGALTGPATETGPSGTRPGVVERVPRRGHRAATAGHGRVRYV